ncbi:MAG: hypothetical protein ACREJN_12890, partial [Nitrospiraceae bacterium]
HSAAARRFEPRRLSLAIEAISSQRSAISAFIRILSLTESPKCFTKGKLQQLAAVSEKRRAHRIWRMADSNVRKVAGFCVGVLRP